MLSIGFLLGLAGLALLDAVVTSTVFFTLAILLFARRPASTSIAYAIGQLSSFFLLSVLLYLGASFMAEVMDTFTLWARRFVLVAAAVFFAILAIRRLKARPRKGLHLPDWVNPWTALPFGIVVMLVDLPFSFPMFLAVERLADTGIETAASVMILAGYTVVSSLPTVLLIIVGITFRQRVRALLQRLMTRFTTGYTKRSWLLFTLHMSIATISILALLFVLD